MNELLEFLLADEQLFTTITLFILIALLVGHMIAEKFKKYQDVDVNEAVSLMDDDNLVKLDVREAKERKAGFIEGDTHIPLAQVKKSLDSIDKDKKVLVYCRTGSRSSHIAALLSRNGFEHVYNLKGGIRAWEKANMPIKF